MKKLQFHLLFYAITMGIIIVLGFGYFTFFTLRDNAVQNAESALLISARDAAKLVASRNEIQFVYLEALASRGFGSENTNPMRDQILALEKENSKSKRFDRIGIADLEGHLFMPKTLDVGIQVINISQRAYYHEALKGKRALMNPTVTVNQEFHDQLVVVYAVPIYADDKITNVLVGTSDSAFISELSNDIKFGSTGYAYIIDSTGTVIAHVDKTLVESQFNVQTAATKDVKYQAVQDVFSYAQTAEEGFSHYTFNDKPLFVAFAKIPATDWTLFIAIPEEEVMEIVSPVLNILIANTLVVIFLGIIIYFRMRTVVQKRDAEIELEKNALAHLATYDALTGVYNRSAGLLLLTDRMALSQREQKPFCVVFIDVDNLKTTNDNFGHQSGDHLIATITEIILKKIRKTDSICRVGGDEFVIGLYDCHETYAKTIMNNICEAMRDYNVVSRQEYALEISFGITEFNPNHHQNIDMLIEEADRLMYENKRNKKPL